MLPARALRSAGLKKRQLVELPAGLVHSFTGLPIRRCKELRALLRFETLGSVGPSIARDLWSLGYRDVDDLKGEDPHRMYLRLCRLASARIDPCAEDVFRAAVAQAEDPKLAAAKRNWWYWTPMRRGDA